MIEAVPALCLVAVAVASYTAARVYVANPANHNAAEDMIRLRQQRVWLSDRLERAWRENWEQTMVAQIADELESIEAVLSAKDSWA